MQTINNRMTETQIADLFSLAVQLQVKAEESDDRDTAILAYSIQNACSNLTESRREFWAADATINNLELKITDMAVHLANAESKCRELAAEVQAVRWACGQVYVKGYNHGHLNTVDRLPYADEKDLLMRGGEVLCEFTDLDHCGMATDAILAEMRAQGVEMFAHDVGESEQGNGLMKAIGRRAIKFAAKLRKGAAL
ncbi:hypothetical protein [Citrobacter freundii]|uniref:hypothetical protein n=1 Tax=Citrobacter freundii TaxID=546 RepID=UPI002DB72CFC|nr:hypothetical protein [Citrobacter freundii]MEB6425431.1 hypothetical protein [Citrobacter freundii]